MSKEQKPTADDPQKFGELCDLPTTPFPGNYQNYTGAKAEGVILYAVPGDQITGIGDISIYPEVWADYANNRNNADQTGYYEGSQIPLAREAVTPTQALSLAIIPSRHVPINKEKLI